jgi:hypothetical protein
MLLLLTVKLSPSSVTGEQCWLLDFKVVASFCSFTSVDVLNLFNGSQFVFSSWGSIFGDFAVCVHCSVIPYFYVFLDLLN